jgi:beta-N-acetylhexosaminidase
LRGGNTKSLNPFFLKVSAPVARHPRPPLSQHAPLIIDIAGLTLSKADRQRLKHPLVGGLILFARNWQNREQLSALCRAIKKVRHDLLICVDHEGGRVQRFKTDGFTHLPPMRALGDMWCQDGKGAVGSGAMRATAAATATGFVLGAELRACGVDFSFTPVLDLDFGESSVIGDRALARDPRVVSLLAKSLMHGLLQSGMANCGKHFPGHGGVKADSHTDVPVDKRSLKTLLADDAAPYGWLGNSLSSVMPAHVIYPKVDTRPAGFSSKWLNEILRAQLGFGGAIFSDDLSMAGARLIDGQQVSYTEAALAALHAGCDLVLLCNQSLNGGAGLDALINGLTEAQLKGQWQPEERSEERRLALLPRSPAPVWDDLMVQSDYMQALSLIA